MAVVLLPATRDEWEWRLASFGNKAKNYSEYLKSWPKGRYSLEAGARYDERSWADAQTKTTPECYMRYEQTHPKGKHVQEARARIEGLTWQQATNGNTVQSFEGYLKKYDSGKFAVDARTRIENLTWQKAEKSNTLRALRPYFDAYPKGRFIAEATTRQSALRLDEAPYLAALKKGTESALKEFLSEYPEHAKEADAKQMLNDITEGRDIVDLLEEMKIEIKTQGRGIENVSVQVRKVVPYPLTVRIPVGTFFVSANQSAQNMITTGESKVRLIGDEWHSMLPSTACANRPLHIPSGSDSFSVQRSPNQEELARLMPILDKANVDYAIRQAAVWIVTDNASYNDLGILEKSSSGFYNTRVIREGETAQAMKICVEAGIDITRKAIWKDRQQVLNNLKDENLKHWLEKKQ